jgi:hypothetical protein
MKLNKQVWIALGLLVVVASLYKVWDGRPWGFAPQIAMAVFSGTIIKDKKWAFVLPLLSMFLSDALYQLLYVNGLSSIPGFYSGQITNYVLFLFLTVFGFWVRTINWAKIAVASVAAPTAYFLLSNFSVWAGGGGLHRPKTWDGLLMAFNDGAPFYKGSVEGTVVFSIILFGGFVLLNRLVTERKHQLA